MHGDYDVDGVSATAVLVRALRTVGGDVDWYLPSRIDDGYGLARATVDRLAARGTQLLVTVDCAITAVEEVAAARAAGLDVVVTDHHAPRADGVLPDAPIVHPRIGGYPCPELCAAGVAHLLARALLEAAGMDPAAADADLDLVALATVADCVPLVDENRRLVRAGLRALASTRKAGLQALMQVARVDPSGVDAGAIGFRLAPRINAAGRLHRADAGLELLLTTDVERARAVAAELDAVNVERRDVETRILFEAEAQVAEARAAGAEPAAYVLAADGWHPGVIGIVASRIAERHHRPAVLIALDGDEGTGSGRSIPAFDLLGGLEAASADLLRHGGHRAAAGLTIARGRVEAFRAAFVAHAAAVAAARGPRAGPARGRGRARRRAPPPAGRGAPAARAVRHGQPGADAARAERAARRPARHGGGPARLVHARGRRRAVALRRLRPRQLAARPRRASRSTRRSGSRSTATTARSSRGSCCATPARPARRRSACSASRRSRRRSQAELARDLVGCARSRRRRRTAGARGGPRRPARHRGRHRGAGRARGPRRPRQRHRRPARATSSAGGAPVLAVAAHAGQRARALGDRVGGFAVTSWAALEADPDLAAGFTHVVAVDPPPHAQLERAGRAPARRRLDPPGLGRARSVELARRVLTWELDLRAPLADLYRGLRPRRRPAAPAAPSTATAPASPVLGGEALAELLRGAGRSRGPGRSPGGCCACWPSSA